MPEEKPQGRAPGAMPQIAVGAAEECPIVLIEATGALGVLAAERRCPDETLERVLYFRSLMGKPYASFFEVVELSTIDGFSVARAVEDDTIFYEPSSVPYAVTNISRQAYDLFVDYVVDYECDLAERFVAIVFSQLEGFSLDSNERLIPPKNYATDMDQFLSAYSFVQPNEPSKKPG